MNKNSIIAKITLVLAISLLFSLNSNAQYLSPNDLINCAKGDIEYFDSFATGKGFSFLKIDKDGGYVYTKNDGNKYLTFFNKFSDYKNYVQLQTLDSKEYLQIKNKIIELGYSRLEEPNQSGIAFKYSKGKNLFILRSVRGKQNTIYQINFYLKY